MELRATGRADGGLQLQLAFKKLQRELCFVLHLKASFVTEFRGGFRSSFSKGSGRPSSARAATFGKPAHRASRPLAYSDPKWMELSFTA